MAFWPVGLTNLDVRLIKVKALVCPLRCAYLWGMKHALRRHISTGLMRFSLLLLGLFLLWFLQRAYRDERAALKKEGELLLVNAIRDIEKNAFQHLLQGDSLIKTINIQHHRHASDSLRMMAIINEKATVIQLKSTDSMPLPPPEKMGIRIQSSSSAATGALSVMLTLPSPQMRDTGRSLREILSDNFAQNMLRSGPPLPWRMVQQADSIPEDPKAIASYIDLSSNERFDVYFDRTSWFLLLRIWPQVLFAALLFTTVTLSFALIARNLRQQQRLTELKNDLIRNITHELKTPIATVGVAIEALQHFGALQDPARTREYLDIAQSELRRLALLVDKVLRMSQFEADVYVLHQEPTDLRELTEEVLASMRLQFEKHRATVHSNLSEGPLTVPGDRLHLSGVIYNLIDNALKYSTLSPEITVELQQVGDQVQLSVSDNGCGIPNEYQGRIFDKFFRVPTGDIHNVKGYGLGLSYVANVVRQHQGHIAVRSAAGAGACFTITLPLYSPAT